MLVIPSRQEAMSIVVLEAGMVKRAVLLTNRCGFEEIEKIGGGMLVEPTVDRLAEGIVDLTRDGQRLMRMGATLHRYVIDHYDWGVITDRYLALYASILSGPGSKWTS